eukprot:366086-Chlamydomonas_euryale.AAC.11
MLPNPLAAVSHIATANRTTCNCISQTRCCPIHSRLLSTTPRVCLAGTPACTARRWWLRQAACQEAVRKRFRGNRSLEAHLPQLLHAFRNHATHAACHAQVERVLDREGARGKKGQRPQYLVKWRGLEYSKSTWERELELVSDLDKLREYKARCRRPPPPPSGPRAAVESAKTFAMPQFRSGRTLRDYQDTSVRWMVSNFRCGRSCVLGDEMGLGKTAQSIAVLEVLRRLDGVRGPFLLVAPLTTLGHWQREIQTWTDLNAVLYAGGHEDRQIIQDVELFYGKPRAGCRVYMPEDVKVGVLMLSGNVGGEVQGAHMPAGVDVGVARAHSSSGRLRMQGIKLGGRTPLLDCCWSAALGQGGAWWGGSWQSEVEDGAVYSSRAALDVVDEGEGNVAGVVCFISRWLEP